LHWVRALTVPMHLGLIDSPFVPHNLIAAQESPVLLPKFQMASRLKILMSSGSKKGTPRYTILFCQKVQASESPPGSPVGPLWREIPVYRPFLRLSWYISLTYLSGSAVKEPSLQVPVIESPQREMPHSKSPPSFINRSPQYTSPHLLIPG
jgi:hypothetical protein